MIILFIIRSLLADRLIRILYLSLCTIRHVFLSFVLLFLICFFGGRVHFLCVLGSNIVDLDSA